jgi:hypothetical protein
MISPAEQKAIDIAVEFIAAEFDNDLEATGWLARKIAAAIEAAVQTGYAKAMRKRF